MNKMVIDISEWQEPRFINYDVLSKEIAGVVVRVQYGSDYIDKHFQTHIREFQKRGVPVAVYAWVRGTSLSDMMVEANDFYQRAKEFQPVFWWLDVEEKSMIDMRNGVEAYRKELKRLSDGKVGVYVANHLYQEFHLMVENFEGVWIPTYGNNDGYYSGFNPTCTNDYDIHQYTSKGRLKGYVADLDLNRLVKDNFNYFFGGSEKEVEEKGGFKMKVVVKENGVKLRSGTGISNDSNVIARLQKGDKVEIYKVVADNGFVWGVQKRMDGTNGFIDIGKVVEWVGFE